MEARVYFSPNLAAFYFLLYHLILIFYFLRSFIFLKDQRRIINKEGKDLNKCILMFWNFFYVTSLTYGIHCTHIISLKIIINFMKICTFLRSFAIYNTCLISIFKGWKPRSICFGTLCKLRKTNFCLLFKDINIFWIIFQESRSGQEQLLIRKYFAIYFSVTIKNCVLRNKNNWSMVLNKEMQIFWKLIDEKQEQLMSKHMTKTYICRWRHTSWK